MADKLTALTVVALGKVAASPAGMKLYGIRSSPGLFPNTATGKTAAKRAIDNGLLTPNRLAPDSYSATETGLHFLLDQSNPKAVLEDLVRGMEARQAQVDDLLYTAHAMSDELTALKATVAAVLPAVVNARVSFLPSPLGGEGPGVRGVPINDNAIDPRQPSPLTPSPFPPRGEGNGTMTRTKPRTNTATAIFARLADWSSTAAAGQDCPLPDLYRSLTVCDDLTVGRFHDELRSLYAAKKLYLHPWTGPLYALPEPTFALLIGHEVAYYASPNHRSQDSGVRSQKSPVVSDS